MGDKDTPQAAPGAPSLPKGVPDDLRKFLMCEANQVTLKDGEIGWFSVKGSDLVPASMAEYVPDKIMNGTVHPSLSITPDPAAPGKASVRIGIDVPGFGTVGPSVSASVDNGSLSVDTSGLPQSLKDPIDSAVKNLNDWFKANGKGFGAPTFGKGTTKLAKVDLKPATQTTTPPPPPPPPGPPKAVTPPPTTPPPVSGGCLGILGLLALVLVGGIVFLGGGGSLGLFGAQGPSASATPTSAASGTPTPAPAPTPSPTPAPQIARSNDGLVTVTAPFGSLPAGTSLTVTTQGQADLPPELAGVTVRSAYYRVGPAGTTFTGQVTYERIIDLVAQGIDAEKQGYPIIQLAERSDDGKWSWLSEQHKLVGGPDGKGDENRPTQTGILGTTGQVFGLGGAVYLHRQPYPEAGSSFSVGQPIPLGALVTGPDSQVIPLERRPTIANVVPTEGLSNANLTYSTPVVVDNATRQAAEISVTCTQPGDYVVGVQMDVTPKGTNSLLDRLHLSDQPTSTIAWTTSVHCVAGPPPVGGFQPVIESGCMRVNHVATVIAGQSYPSNTLLDITFASDPEFPANATFGLSYREGTNPTPLRFLGVTIETSGTRTHRVEFKTGITSYGQKTFVSAAVDWLDGSKTMSAPVSMENWDNVFGSTWNVTSAQGPIAGNACQ